MSDNNGFSKKYGSVFVCRGAFMERTRKVRIMSRRFIFQIGVITFCLTCLEKTLKVFLKVYVYLRMA